MGLNRLLQQVWPRLHYCLLMTRGTSAVGRRTSIKWLGQIADMVAWPSRFGSCI